MDGFADELLGILNGKVAFTIPGVNIPVTRSVVVTWIIMVFLVVMAKVLTSKMEIVPGKKQAVAELIVTKMENFFGDLVGEHGTRYVPYLSTVFLYLLFANMIGVLGFSAEGLKAPTQDLGVTGALAIMSIVLVQIASVQTKGVKGWLKSFAEPVPILLPINFLELFIKPLSLCMRLFGNVLGACVIMTMIDLVCKLFLPLAMSAYFDLFDGAIQAYVFVFLTSMYIKEATEIAEA